MFRETTRMFEQRGERTQIYVHVYRVDGATSVVKRLAVKTGAISYSCYWKLLE